MERICIDGACIADKADLYAAFAPALPQCCGHNLDALYDALTERSQPLTIELAHVGALDRSLGAYASALRRMLLDAAAENPALALEERSEAVPCSARNIAVLGSNRSENSALAHALAKALGYREIAAEDYRLPAQSASPCSAPTDCSPCCAAQSWEEAPREMPADAQRCPGFIWVGEKAAGLSDIPDRIDVAFWVRSAAAQEECILSDGVAKLRGPVHELDGTQAPEALLRQALELLGCN